MLKNRLCYGLLLLCTSAFFIFFNGYLSLYVFVLSLLFPVVAFLVSLPGMLGARLSLEIGSKSGEKKHFGNRFEEPGKGNPFPCGCGSGIPLPFAAAGCGPGSQ